MTNVKPKKFLGQHFLTDRDIALKITEALVPLTETGNVLEIGAGMGVLTRFLQDKKDINLKVIDIDRESIRYLNENFPGLHGKIIQGDFLNFQLGDFFGEPFTIIGNFPYNISSQILFRIIEYRQLVLQMVGMFQKEVALRICAVPKKKDYGIVSVFLQAFYHTEYLFTVDENVFHPPPKVKSGVVRLIRKKDFTLGADEKHFFRVVKTAFNQRRKTLRNALKSLPLEKLHPGYSFLSKRAEELTVEEFIDLTNLLFPQKPESK